MEVDYDSDMWADWPDELYQPWDTEENRRTYPDHFYFPCCKRDGTARGCTTGPHEAAYEQPTPAPRPRVRFEDQPEVHAAPKASVRFEDKPQVHVIPRGSPGSEQDALAQAALKRMKEREVERRRAAKARKAEEARERGAAAEEDAEAEATRAAVQRHVARQKREAREARRKELERAEMQRREERRAAQEASKAAAAQASHHRPPQTGANRAAVRASRPAEATINLHNVAPPMYPPMQAPTPPGWYQLHPGTYYSGPPLYLAGSVEGGSMRFTVNGQSYVA